MFSYDFMLRAFAGSGAVAIVAGTVGYFLVLRGQTFAGHALSHVGFAGATGAALFGISPLAGMLVFNLAAGVGMGLLGERLSGRDVAIGIILALALAFGLLFLNLYTSNAAQATALLFGNVLAVSPATLRILLGLAVVTFLALGFL
ncbi:MAG: metal ABC transporter permease, partial [Bauldia sp.]